MKSRSIPDDLKRFLRTVDQQIQADASETKVPSDDLLQCRCAYGGLCEEGGDSFGFSYFPRDSDGEWELFLTRAEIRVLAQDAKETIELWYCTSEACPHAFSDKTSLCDKCDWIDDPSTDSEDKDAGATSKHSLADFAESLLEQDPDFWKVDNTSGTEFAFEITGSPSVSEIFQMTESDAASQVTATNDYGENVEMLPLKETCNRVFTDVSRYVTVLGEEETITPGAFIHRVASHIMTMLAHPEEFEIYPDELEDIKALKFYRLYHSKNDSWWSCSFDPE